MILMQGWECCWRKSESYIFMYLFEIWIFCSRRYIFTCAFLKEKSRLSLSAISTLSPPFYFSSSSINVYQFTQIIFENYWKFSFFSFSSILKCFNEIFLSPFDSPWINRHLLKHPSIWRYECLYIHNIIVTKWIFQEGLYSLVYCSVTYIE